MPRRTPRTRRESQVIKSDETLLSLLDVLYEDYCVGISEIAARTGRSKSVVYRHLNTLRQHGLVVKEDDGYRLSLWFLDIGTAVRQRHGLYGAAKTELDQLVERCGQRIWCLVEENGQGIMIYGKSAKRASLSPSRLGNRTHLHHTAAGKAVLAHLPAERAEAIVADNGLPAAAPATITDEETLMSELMEIRERGHAFNEEEFGRGFHGVGVPLFDGSESPIGAISVSGPKGTLQGDYFREELPDVLKQTADQIEFNFIYDVQS